jgi:hypothetical protein
MSVDEDWQMLLAGAYFSSMYSASFECFPNLSFEGMKLQKQFSAERETQDNFVLIKGYTDFGTEVEYLYNPKSGEARTRNGHIRTPKHI